MPVIFDTDIGNDVDDVMALALLHALEQRGACRLLAVTITKDHPWAPEFTDALNTFYDRPDIPIGRVKEGATREAGKFLGLAKEKVGGAWKYPHDLDGESCPEAVSLLRQTLAGQEDHSVVMIQVGFFTNFSRLLESPPDSHSPLPGRELIQQKVRLLSVMAGEFRPGERKEYNVVKDVPAARRFAQDWPTPVVWSGFDIGITIPYPHQSIERDYQYVTDHPVKVAYERYQPPPHDRPTWDLTSVLHAVYPDRDYFQLSEPGRVDILDDGTSVFKPEALGRDRYLKTDPVGTARVRELFVQLCSTPPPRLVQPPSASNTP